MHIRQKQDAQKRRTTIVSWVALALVVGAYVFAREPVISTGERLGLAERFRFDIQVLDVEAHAPRGLLQTREVHPSLKRIEAWIAATGAAITLADLDRDGLFNDMLLVDPRLNTVLVQPVPGTGIRYSPFTLDPTPLAFNERMMSPTGSLVGDFNEDGLEDILVHYWGRTPVIFLRHSATEFSVTAPAREQFKATELVPNEEELPERWFTHAATQSDIDGDGHLDLLIGNFFQDGADILNSEGTGIASVMHAGKSNARNGGGAKLFLWTPPQDRLRPNQFFVNASHAIEEHCGKGWVLAIGSVDLDPDNGQWRGLPEVYIAHDFGPDRLLHNRSTPGNPQFVLCEGERGFTTPKSFVLGHDSYKGMGLDFGDVNGDGLFDMYISNIADDFALHEGHFVFVSTGAQAQFQDEIAPYRQQSSSMGLVGGGWGWDCRFVDFDNDGTLEAIQATGFAKGTVKCWCQLHALGTTNDRLVSNPSMWPKFKQSTADLSGHNTNPFCVQSKSGRYVDIAADLGMNEYWNTRGLAVADIDGDGWQDFIAANQWEPSVLFRNRSHETSAQNGFLAFHLILPPTDSTLEETRVREGHPDSSTPGRPAIGATAKITLPDGRVLISQVDGGSGHSGKRAPTVHFGLGQNPPDSVSVELTWRNRDGNTQHDTVSLTPQNWYTIELGRASR